MKRVGVIVKRVDIKECLEYAAGLGVGVNPKMAPNINQGGVKVKGEGKVDKQWDQSPHGSKAGTNFVR